MPVLFALSILAFVALLWATISIAGFVRRARRRRQHRAAKTADRAASGQATGGDPKALFFYDHEAVPPPLPQSQLSAPPPVPSAVSSGGEYVFFEEDLPASVDGVELPTHLSMPDTSSSQDHERYPGRADNDMRSARVFEESSPPWNTFSRYSAGVTDTAPSRSLMARNPSREHIH